FNTHAHPAGAHRDDYMDVELCSPRSSASATSALNEEDHLELREMTRLLCSQQTDKGGRDQMELQEQEDFCRGARTSSPQPPHAGGPTGPDGATLPSSQEDEEKESHRRTCAGKTKEPKQRHLGLSRSPMDVLHIEPSRSSGRPSSSTVGALAAGQADGGPPGAPAGPATSSGAGGSRAPVAQVVGPRPLIFGAAASSSSPSAFPWPTTPEQLARMMEQERKTSRGDEDQDDETRRRPGKHKQVQRVRTGGLDDAAAIAASNSQQQQQQQMIEIEDLHVQKLPDCNMRQEAA
ncbi:unnamed protein product, partial [Amoebophrya sp. A120]